LVDAKKFKQHLLVIAFALAGVIFLAGLALGWTMDNFKVSAITTALKQNELNSESFLLESQFMENFGGDYCDLLNIRITDLQKTIAETGEKLTTWSAGAKSKEQDFDYLKRKYFLLEIRFLFLLEDMTQTCGKTHDTILFFYTIDDSQSIRQGQVLDELRRTRDDLIVLSFDKDYADEPLIKVLLTRYGVKDAPATVINGKDVLTGYASSKQIEELLS